MFACSEYPTGRAFLDNVRSEVADVADALGHHPSIALWSANNENQHFATHFRNPDAIPRNTTAYHELYLVTVRGALAEADPWRPFWPSSPSNGMLADDVRRGIHIQRWGDEYDPTIGDIHFYDYETLCVDQAGIPSRDSPPSTGGSRGPLSRHGGLSYPEPHPRRTSTPLAP